MRDDIGFLLGLWGAGLATVLAILRLLEFRYQMGSNLLVSAAASPPFRTIDVELTSTGRKPIVVTGIRLSYGRAAHAATNVLSLDQSPPLKLTEGDYRKISVDRDRLVARASGVGVRQEPYSHLWVAVETATGRTFYRRVVIDPVVIDRPYYGPAEPFIAADLLLGFPQMDSHFPANIIMK